MMLSLALLDFVFILRHFFAVVTNGTIRSKDLPHRRRMNLRTRWPRLRLAARGLPRVFDR